MSEPFIGEIKMYGFNWPPKNWAQCDGALIPLKENPALYTLIGTAYGGDGQTNFALPDLRGRVPLHRGILGNYGYTLGDKGGLEYVPLGESQLPSHTHSLNVTNDPGTAHAGTEDRIFAASNTSETYGPAKKLTNLNESTCSFEGGSAQHKNIQPIQVVNFCISLDGIFPQRP